MKPPPFTYHRAASIEEAVALLGGLENAKILAGGQSLMAMLNLRYLQPDNIIDINRIPDLSGIVETGGILRIGAMTRQQRIKDAPAVRATAPILAEALAHVGHRQTRNRGTIGGSLCHLDPAAELPMLALLHDATVMVAGPRGQRGLPMQDFIVDYMTTALAADEILVAVELPIWPVGHGYGFKEFARRRGDFAIAAAGCLLTRDGAGKIVRAAIALAGVAATPIRLREAEASLIGHKGNAELFANASEQCARIPAVGDVHATADYRKSVAAVMLRRALADAWKRANGEKA